MNTDDNRAEPGVDDTSEDTERTGFSSRLNVWSIGWIGLLATGAPVGGV